MSTSEWDVKRPGQAPSHGMSGHVDPPAAERTHLVSDLCQRRILGGGLLVATRASSALLAVLIIPVPLLMLWRPSRVHWPMTVMLTLTYAVVTVANHPDAMASAGRSSLAVIFTVGLITETLYHTSRARLRAEAALRAKNEELEQAVQRAHELAAIAQEADQMKSEFVAATSHELRTPLTGILGSLDLVLDGHCQSPAEERRFLQMAHDSAHKLLGVVNAVLNLARVEAGRVEVDPAPVAADLIVGEVNDLCQMIAADRGLTLIVCPAPEAQGWVLTDADKLRQILLNLVGNALKFTSRGTVTISLDPEPASSLVHIRVRDTGIGIAVEEQNRLFQPFVQANASIVRTFGGTGLGLAISRRLAERMQGTIRLHSDGLGLGTTVTVSLPMAEPPTPVELPAHSAAQAAL